MIVTVTLMVQADDRQIALTASREDLVVHPYGDATPTELHRGTVRASMTKLEELTQDAMVSMVAQAEAAIGEEL